VPGYILVVILRLNVLYLGGKIRMNLLFSVKIIILEINTAAGLGGRNTHSLYTGF
jgi:hypothetical protein